jgi:hypothetical protein
MRQIFINPDTNWERLRKNINDPTVQSALNLGMNLWCSYFRKEPWQPRKGPWYFSSTDYWAERKKPRKDSPNWYRCVWACEFLSGFTCALAQATYPDFDWRIIEGDRHSTVVGYSESAIRVLDFMVGLCHPTASAAHILENVGFPNNCRQLTLDEEMQAKQLELEAVEKARNKIESVVAS